MLNRTNNTSITPYFFHRPRDASEILTNELEQSTKTNTSLNSSINSDDDMFSGFSISQSTKKITTTTHAGQQQKFKTYNDVLKYVFSLKFSLRLFTIQL